jgi:hypothetical protein
LPSLGWSWGKVVERVGLILLAVLSLIISWVLVVRAFNWVLDRLDA